MVENGNMWTIIAALGQWACAIATFMAVIVALKPYKKGFQVSISNVILASGDKRQCIPQCIKIKNKGYKKAVINSVGICENNYQIVLHDNPLEIEAESLYSIPLGYKELKDSFMFDEIKTFRVFIEDSMGNRYDSKEYEKRVYTEGGGMLDMFM